MQIAIAKILIENFKGIKKQEIDFGGVTNIKADNAVGKTSVFDAFCWLLFGKDSKGSTKFGVRPLDKDNKTIDFVDISVEALLYVDGKKLALKKTQKQKWVKKRGAKDQTFDGNINEFEVDEFPKSETDFNEAIRNIITDDLFIMVTNPAHFPTLNWKDQRDTLVNMVGEIRDEEVIKNNIKYAPIEEKLKEASIDEWKSKYTKALREYNIQINAIPGRIDEVSRNIVEIDFETFEAKLAELKASLEEVEGQIENHSKGFDELSTISAELFALKTQLQQIENTKRAAREKNINELQLDKNNLDNLFNSLNGKTIGLRNNTESLEQRIENNEKQLDSIRTRFKEVEAEEFNETDLTCPTCKQELQGEAKDLLINSFSEDKTARLLLLREEGIKLGKQINQDKALLSEAREDLEKYISEKTEIVGRTNKVLKSIEELPEINLEEDTEYMLIRKELSEKQKEIDSFKRPEDLTKALKEKKALILKEVDTVKEVLGQKIVIENSKLRVEELTGEQKDLAKKVADIEKILDLFEEFTKEKMNLLSEIINSKFKIVKWKLFDIQINGGLKEACELTVNGVPYRDLNSAAKVQAGLDIINTLSVINDVSAPIFIDNREGINEVPEVDAQIINLIVTKDKKMKVGVE